MEHPAQRAEGRLIEQAMKRRGLKIRALARDLDMSDTRVGQIIKGYQIPQAGLRVPVTGPAATVARIAEYLEIDPSELDVAGRPDVAQLMREWAGTDHQDPGSPATSGVPPDSGDDLRAAVRQLQADMERIKRQVEGGPQAHESARGSDQAGPV